MTPAGGPREGAADGDSGPLPSGPRGVVARLRLWRPWRFKAPLLVAVPYLFVELGGVPPGRALAGLAFACAAIAGVAGFAYALNDLADRRQDERAGRPNAFTGDSPLRPGWVVGISLALAVGPWIVFFPVDRWIVALLGLELGLLALYALPPARLKERGAVGVWADALYAHALPAVLAGYTFLRLGEDPHPRWATVLTLLGVWQLAVGLRNILLHQLDDLEADRAAGTSTWAGRRGQRRSERLLRLAVVPFEIGSLVAFLAAVTPIVPTLVPGYLLFAVWAATRRSSDEQERPHGPLRERLAVWLNAYYVDWLPLLVLADLCWGEPRHLGLPALHLVLFRSAIGAAVAAAGEWLRRRGDETGAAARGRG